MICKVCGATVADDARYCLNCGAILEAAPQQTATSETSDYSAETPVIDDYSNNGNTRNIPTNSMNKATLLGLLIGGSVAILAIACGIFFFFNKPDERLADAEEYYVTGVYSSMDIYDGDTLVSKVKAGDAVKVLEKHEENGWEIYVPSNSAKGYIDSNLLTEDENAVCTPYELYAKSDKIRLFPKPGVKKNAICKLKKGYLVTVLADYDDQKYVYDEASGNYGYVYSSGLTDYFVLTGKGDKPDYDYGTYYVNVKKGKTLAIFDENNKKIGTVARGKKVLLLNDSSEKWYVYAGGKYGFVNPAKLSDTKPKNATYKTYYVNYEKVTKNGSFLSLRSKNDLDKTIDKLYHEEVHVKLDDNGDIIKKSAKSVHSSEGTVEYWLVYVPSIDKTGYVNSLYLKK